MPEAHRCNVPDPLLDLRTMAALPHYAARRNHLLAAANEIARLRAERDALRAEMVKLSESGQYLAKLASETGVERDEAQTEAERLREHEKDWHSGEVVLSELAPFVAVARAAQQVCDQAKDFYGGPMNFTPLVDVLAHPAVTAELKKC